MKKGSPGHGEYGVLPSVKMSQQTANSKAVSYADEMPDANQKIDAVVSTLNGN